MVLRFSTTIPTVSAKLSQGLHPKLNNSKVLDNDGNQRISIKTRINNQEKLIKVKIKMIDPDPMVKLCPKISDMGGEEEKKLVCRIYKVHRIRL